MTLLGFTATVLTGRAIYLCCHVRLQNGNMLLIGYCLN